MFAVLLKESLHKPSLSLNLNITRAVVSTRPDSAGKSLLSSVCRAHWRGVQTWIVQMHPPAALPKFWADEVKSIFLMSFLPSEGRRAAGWHFSRGPCQMLCWAHAGRCLQPSHCNACYTLIFPCYFPLWLSVSKPNQCLCGQNCIHFKCKTFTAVVFIKLSFSFLPRKFSSTCDVEWYSAASPELQKGVFLFLSRVFRGENNLWVVLERLWQQQNLKVQTNSGLVHENLLLFVQSFPCYRWIFNFFASQQLQPSHLMCGFSECLPSSLLLLTCGRLICGLWVPQIQPFIPIVRQRKSYLEEKKTIS